MRPVIVNPGSERLRARTVAIPDPGDLERYLVPGDSQAFLRRGDGMIGIGSVARFRASSLDAADIWWTEFLGEVENETELWGVRGTGPVAFGSFAFNPDGSDEPSTLVVPEVVIGRRRDLAWMTRIGRGDVIDRMPTVQSDPARPVGVNWSDGATSEQEWTDLVAQVVAMIKAGSADKVVLARDLRATAEADIDERWLVNQLVNRYRDCWVYLVDGLVGASPEMLVRREGGLATSRVLAGTIRRGAAGSAEDADQAHRLIASVKDMREHEFAVESVAQALAPFCEGMNVPDAPYVLELPNVLHLATDITGVAGHEASSLKLAAALHPSAAVCGTPTHVAQGLIDEFEGMDRGRYAGPVGWIDSQGDGEWAIALRGGHLNGNQLHAFAGCGIVRDSDPATELAETEAKFLPIREALGD